MTTGFLFGVERLIEWVRRFFREMRSTVFLVVVKFGVFFEEQILRVQGQHYAAGSCIISSVYALTAVPLKMENNYFL